MTTEDNTKLLAAIELLNNGLTPTDVRRTKIQTELNRLVDVVFP